MNTTLGSCKRVPRGQKPPTLVTFYLTVFHIFISTGNYSFSEDSAAESTSDDERSSVRSSEADQTKFESHPEDRVDDDNNNDKDDEISFTHRKNKLVSSRLTSSHQKRTYSDADDDDDESDDDMELSRISEMVKRKKLAAAERSEKAKTTALESRSTASDGQSAKEDLCGNKVDTDQNLPSISATNEESLIKPKVKSDDRTEVDSTDETSKIFKRKTKASEKPKEKMVPKSQDIFDDDDDKSVDERSKKFRRKRISSEKTKDKSFSRNDDTDDVDNESVVQTSKNFRRKRTTLEKPNEKMDPQSEEIFDDDDKSVDEVSKKLKRKRKTSEKAKETPVSRNDDVDDNDDQSVDEISKKLKRKRKNSEKAKETPVSRNDDVDDNDDQSVDEISKKFKRKRKTSVKAREKTFPKSEDAETDGKSVIIPRKKLRKRGDLVESTPVPKRAYRKKKAETTKSDNDDDDEVDDDVEGLSKDKERNKAASKLQRKSSLSDSSLSIPDKIQLVEKNDNIFHNIVSPQGHSPPREFCTKSFDNNPYISDISDAEFDESAVNTNEGKITSDMFRANIFTNVLGKLSDQSPATDQHSFSEPQSNVGFSEPQSDAGFLDQATDNESLKNVEKDGMKRDVNKQERSTRPLKEKKMSTGEKCVPPKETGVDVLLEASFTDVVKLEDNITKSEKMQKRKRLSSRELIEDKDSVKVDKRKDHEQDVVAEVKAGKLKEDENAAKKSKKRRRSETEESRKKRRKSESLAKELSLDQSGDKSMEERLDHDSKNSSDKRVTLKKEIKNDLDDGEVASSKVERESKKKSVRSRLDSSEGSTSYSKKEDTKASKSPKEKSKYHEHEVALDSKKKKSSSTKSKLALSGMTSSSDTSDSEAFLDVVRLPVEKKKKSKLDPDFKDDTLKLSAEVDRDSKRDINPHKVRKARHDSSSKAPIDGKTKESKKHKAKDSKPGKSDGDNSLHRKKSVDKDSEDSKGVELKFNEFTKASEKEKYGSSEEKIRKIDMSSFKSEKHKKLSPLKDPRESKVSTKETKEAKALFKKSKEAKTLGTDSKSYPQEKKISSKEKVESVGSSKESRETKSPHKKSMDSKVLTKDVEQTKSTSKEAKVSKTGTKDSKISSKETSEASNIPKESMESESPFKKSHDSKTFAKESEKLKASYKESKELKSLVKETKISLKDTPESSKSSKESKSPFKKSNESKTFPKESELSKSSSKESKDMKISSKEPKESKLAAKQSKESKLSSSKDHKDSKATNLKDSKIASKEPKITPIKAKRESKDVDLKIWDFGLQLTPVMKVSKSGKSQTKSKESRKIKSSESRNKKERDSKLLDQRLEPKSLEKEKPRAPPILDVCLPSVVEGAESSGSLSLQKKSEKKSVKPVDNNVDANMPEVSKDRDSLDPVEVLHSDGSPPKVTTPLSSPEGRKQIHDEPTRIEEDLKPDENVTEFPPEEVDSLVAGEKRPVDGSCNQDEAPKRALKATEVPKTEIKPLAEDIKPLIEEWKNADKDQGIYVEGAEKEKDNEIVVEEDSKTSVQPLVEDTEHTPVSNSEHPGRYEPKEEPSEAVVDDIGSAMDDTVVKRRSLSDIEDMVEKGGSTDDTVSVAGGKVIERHSLSDIESFAETRESIDEARSSADDQPIKCHSLSEIEDLADKRGSTADAKCGSGGLVLKRVSVSDIEELVEARGSADDTKSAAGDQVVKHGSSSETEGLAETRVSIDDLRSVSSDKVAKSCSLSDNEDLAETRGPSDDMKFVVGDQVVKHHSLSDNEGIAETKGPIDHTRPVVKRRSVSDIENLAETALVASDAVSMDSPRSPHKKSDTSSTNLGTLTSWPKCEETKITTATNEEVKEESTCDDDKTEVLLREMPPHEEEVKNDNEQESKTAASLQEVDKPAAESIKEKVRPEVDGSEIDESKATENKVNEPHEDGISDLGAVSDLEEHLGPFHGTKLEETDIDIKDLSHPEETLKILTQELRNSHAAREQHKDTEHDFSNVKMTGHDFSMLSEEINDKIQRLSSRSFVSELSEEDRHIVNISMEIAENLSQDRDENVDNTLEAIDDIDKDVIGDSCQESLDSGVAEFNKDSNEISETSSPITQQGKDIGIPADKSNDMGLSTTNLSTNTDNGNKSMDSDKLIAVGGPADIKTSITEPRLDSSESSSTTTTTSEHKVSRIVDTEAPVTSQVTDAVCRPTYTRSRTVDLEPRGIAQVVADIDLNSISHCIMDNSGTAREAPPASDNITGPEATKEIEKIDDESLITRPDATEAAHEVSRDSLKKSISPTFPSTWRKALLRDHVKLSQTLPAAYEKFAVVKGNYQLADAQSEGEVR